jgi:hypothetical protein
MDISDIVNYGTLTSWIVAFALWVGRLVRREKPMPTWLRAALSSNVILAFVIFAGIVGMARCWYTLYERDHQTILEDVTVSAYPEAFETQTLKVMSRQTFDNENIPLDGYAYDHCTFINVCLIYNGGAYQLQHATFKDGWRVCTKAPALKNHTDLLFAMQLTRPNSTHTKKKAMHEY